MNSFSIWHLIIIFILVVFLLVTYLFAKSYQLLIEAIGRDYISINPNFAFLIFIPLVGLVFYIVLAFMLRDSLDRMFQDRIIPFRVDAVFISLLALLGCGLLAAIPYLSQVMTLASAVCTGFNWSRVVNTRKLVLKCRAELPDFIGNSFE